MSSRIRAWAQLVRVPNTLTACADVLAGFSIAAGAWSQWNGIAISLVAISAASICLYWAGMVLNDVHDVEVDRILRRKGPLVDGRISIRTAAFAGWSLLLSGVMLAWLAVWFIPENNHQGTWLVVSVSVLLAISITAYDSRLKATACGPLLMGLCRGFNLLLGVSLGACIVWPVNWDWAVVAMAVLGHICFVMGITLAARREGLLQQSRYRLAMSWSVSLIGGAFIAGCSLGSTHRPLRLEPHTMYPILVGLLLVPWLHRAFRSIRDPGVGTLVPAIKQAILSIIFLDAAMTLQFAGNLPGAIVCGLAIPTLALARMFRMT